MLEFLLSSESIIALLTLTFLEIVLGIDNIVFISIAANKLPEKLKRRATNWGLILAMLQRVVLLFFVSAMISLSEPFYTVDQSWLSIDLSWQSIILFSGGIFLIYKSTTEIYDKLEIPDRDKVSIRKKEIRSLSNALVQIMIIDFIFSVDSILTAVGMTSNLHPNHNYTLVLMIIAVVVSIIVMMAFANPIRTFIDKHPSMQLLGLSFLILIGFMLITEAAHVSETVVLGSSIGSIPKGYLYFAISFSLFVEFLNYRFRKAKKSNNDLEE